MTIQPLRVYDYLCRSRQIIFDRMAPLTAEQYAREFPIGPGTLAKTLTHTMISEWYYIARMEQQEVAPYAQWPIRDETPPPFAVLQSEWKKQSELTRKALGAKRDWSAAIQYEVTTDDGRRIRVRTNPADIATQLILHEMHHRAQALNMLRQLGITLTEDLDFNAMMYERTDVT